MAEYIKKNDVIAALQKLYSGEICKLPRDYIIDAIKGEVMDIKAEPVMPCKSGRWVPIMSDNLLQIKCSSCSKTQYLLHNYCPCCGAKMVGDNDV